MKIFFQNWISLAFIGLLFSCTHPSPKNQLDMDQVLAWCIVPFDAQNRNPEQRIAMLRELGIKKYAYDWREKHLDEMVGEWQLAKQNNIEISAVWLWLDARSDTVGRLSPVNERLLQNIDSANLNTDIWLSFNNNYFDSLPADKALAKGVEIVGYIADRAAGLGCKVALYNHGSWFGQPENQINIIKALPGKDIGIVYSFHHAHQQLDRFPQAQEIERKFLVLSTGYKAQAVKKTRITQGYLCSVPERTVRIRIKGDTGYITIKGIGNDSGASRFEWEKEIPPESYSLSLRKKGYLKSKEG